MINKLLNKTPRSSFTIASTIAFVIVLIAYVWLLLMDNELSTEKVKRIYFADNISPAHQKVIDRFNQKYKGKIEVESINIPFSKFSTNERKELFARYLRSKSDQIDIFSVDQIWVPRFAKWCEPLDHYVSAPEKDSILSYALRSCYVSDTLVAMPLFIDVGLMYYRKDLIARLPNAEAVESALQRSISWDDFIKLGRTLKDSNLPFYIFQADNYEGLLCSFTEMIACLHRPLYSNNSLQITSPQALQATTLLVDLVHKHKLSPPLVTQFKEMDSYQYYVDKNGVFLRGWPNFIRDYQSVVGELPIAQKLGKAPLPHFSGYPPTSILGGWNLMISKYSTQKKEAFTFVTFLLSEEAQKIMYEEGGYLPVSSTIYQDAEFLRRHPDLTFYKTLMSTGVHRPSLVDYTKISDIISQCIKSAIDKEMSPRQALERASHLIHAEGVLVP